MNPEGGAIGEVKKMKAKYGDVFVFHTMGSGAGSGTTLRSLVHTLSNTKNKNHYDYPKNNRCYDEDTDEDIREIGLGVMWLKNKWGIKTQAGVGFTETSPDFRVLALINRDISF